MTNKLTLQDMVELRAEASSGKWILHCDTVIGLEVPEFARAEDWIISETFGHGSERDAAFIAAAGNFDFAKQAERVKRLEEALQAAIDCVESLMGDFEGCTDNAQDPDRLHEWDDTISERFDWMEDARTALEKTNDD